MNIFFPFSLTSFFSQRRKITNMTLIMMYFWIKRSFSFLHCAVSVCIKGLSKQFKASNVHLKASSSASWKPIIAVFYMFSFYMHDKSYVGIIYNRYSESAYFTFIRKYHRRFMTNHTLLSYIFERSCKNAKCVKYLCWQIWILPTFCVEKIECENEFWITRLDLKFNSFKRVKNALEAINEWHFEVVKQFLMWTIWFVS